MTERNPDARAEPATVPPASAVRASEADAAVVLETVPSLMRAIRGEMRRGAAPGLSVPQFRVLQFVRRHPGTGLSEIADHLGTTLPAASELVARLVRQGLLTRETDARERRRVCIGLTSSGSTTLDRAQRRALRWLSSVVAKLDPDRRRGLVEGLRELAELVRADVDAEAAREEPPGESDA